ncbi:MAG: hypothetical protein H7210_08290 [Pyrinomonadaceae bacterium]|nr:hypothetical protein [Phycisphaerales bacterium]
MTFVDPLRRYGLSLAAMACPASSLWNPIRYYDPFNQGTDTSPMNHGTAYSPAQQGDYAGP